MSIIKKMLPRILILFADSSLTAFCWLGALNVGVVVVPLLRNVWSIFDHFFSDSCYRSAGRCGHTDMLAFLRW